MIVTKLWLRKYGSMIVDYYFESSGAMQSINRLVITMWVPMANGFVIINKCIIVMKVWFLWTTSFYHVLFFVVTFIRLMGEVIV
ncbi:MAG: hypothetical protein EGQ23_02815 [Solobacterium sp.]|nr:hypothetical protein [Solobacterium sp.]